MLLFEWYRQGYDGLGNPIGGLVFGTAYNGTLRQHHEWTNFMGADFFCFRACLDGPGATEYCGHVRSRSYTFNEVVAYTASGTILTDLGYARLRVEHARQLLRGLQYLPRRPHRANGNLRERRRDHNVPPRRPRHTAGTHRRQVLELHVPRGAHGRRQRRAELHGKSLASKRVC